MSFSSLPKAKTLSRGAWNLLGPSWQVKWKDKRLKLKIPSGVRVTHRGPLPTTQTHPIKALPEVLSPTQGGEQPSCSSGRLAALTNNTQTSNKLFKIFLLFLSFLFWLRVCGEILILTHTILCFKYNFVFWKYFWFERRKRSFLRTFFFDEQSFDDFIIFKLVYFC